MTNQNIRNYNANSNLKASGVKIAWKPEYVEEYIKCSTDPIYFINEYCKIVSLDEGLIPFKLYDCQVEKVRVVHENRKVILMEGRQQGKCCFKTTQFTIRNKKTGEIRSVTAEEFHNMCAPTE